MKKLLLLFTVTLSIGASAQWTQQGLGIATTGTYVFDIEAIDANTAWAVMGDASGSSVPVQDLSVTSDGGTTWTAKTVSDAAANNLNFSNITAINKDTAWVAMYDGTSGGGAIFRTNDGGNNWTQQTTATFAAPNGFPNVVHMNNATQGWAMGDPTAFPTTLEYEIYLTIDGGTNWVRVPAANIPNPTSGEYGYTNVYQTIGNNIWFGTNKGRIYKSIDGGINWTVATTGQASVDDIAFTDNMNGLALNRAGNILLNTTDGGNTWSIVTTSGTLNTSDIEAVPGRMGMYISAGNGSTYSTDNGVTWIDLDPSTQMSALGFVDELNGWGGAGATSTTDGIYKLSTTILSVNETKINASTTIYPNPSKGIFTINSEKAEGANKISIKIYNSLGQIVLSDEMSNSNAMNSKTIDLSGISKGMYFISLNSNVDSTTKKMIIE